MQDESRYKIVYSNQIDIFDRNLNNGDVIPFATYPFGVMNTSGFRKNVEKLKRSGGVVEHYDFYPVKTIQQEPIGYKGDYAPRTYQGNVVKVIEAKQRNNGVVEAPTGAGKTNIMASLVAAKNLSTLIIVPSASLVYQTRERFLKILDIDSSRIGICISNQKDIGSDILIATWQSLQNKSIIKKVQNHQYNMVIVDEAHKASARVLNSIVSSLRSQYKFGFSATVYRTHEYQLEDVYKLLGNKIAKIDIELLYKNGYLLRPKIELMATKSSVSVEQGVMYYFRNKLENNEKMRWVFSNQLFKEKAHKAFAPEGRTIKQLALSPTAKELSLMARIAKEDYIKKLPNENQADSKMAFDKQLGLAKTGIDLYSPRLKRLISKAKNFFKRENEQGAILFNTIEAGEKVAEVLRDAGYSNIIVANGQTDKNYETIDNLSCGKIKDYIVISTVQFLGEGNDIPSLRKVIIGSPVYPPFSDAGRLQQIVGRAMRIDDANPNKQCRIVLADDDTIGWMAEKKNNVINIVNEVVKPSWKIDSKKIILVAGKKRSGKDTFLNTAKEYVEANGINSDSFAFADPMKTILSSMLSISKDTLDEYKNNTGKYSIANNGKFLSFLEYGTAFKEVKKTEVIKIFITAANSELGEFSKFTLEDAKKILSALFGENGKIQTFRELIQNFGFNAMREHCGKNIWIDKMIGNLHSSSAPFIFVSDARTPDEVFAIKEVFKDSHVVKIEREGLSSGDTHKTETLIDEIKTDYIVENNSTLSSFSEKVKNLFDSAFSVCKKDDVLIVHNKENSLSEDEGLENLFQYTNSF